MTRFSIYYLLQTGRSHVAGKVVFGVGIAIGIAIDLSFRSRYRSDDNNWDYTRLPSLFGTHPD